MEERTNVPELRAFILAMLQADTFGGCPSAACSGLRLMICGSAAASGRRRRLRRRR